MKSLLSKAKSVLGLKPKAQLFQKLDGFQMKISDNRWEDQDLLVDDTMIPEDIFASLKNKVKEVKQTYNKETYFDISKITLFLSYEDLMLFTCIPDENFQMSFAPQFKESDFKFTFKDKSTAYVYLQDNIKSFLDFLHDNFNVVIYHTGHEEYANKVFDIIDPDNKFKIKYGRDFCHLYFNQDNEVIEYVRDINLFSDISLKRKVILDSGSISNICSPDNVFVFNKFNPDNPIESLDEIKNKLEELKYYDDVREYLIPTFKMRQMLINSRLI